MKKIILSLIAALTLAAGCGDGHDKSYKSSSQSGAQFARSEISWSGYTNWWNSLYTQQWRAGNLSKINVPDAAKVLEQRRLDLALELGLPGLRMQEGFLAGLLGEEYVILDNPSEKEMNASLGKAKAVLVFSARESELGAKLARKAPAYEYAVPAYQNHGGVKNPLDAFVIKKGGKRIYAAVGEAADLANLRQLLTQTQSLADSYDMKRGWFGVHTDIRTVSCSPITPIETMAAVRPIIP